MPSSAMYCQMSSSVQLREREHPDVLALAVAAVVEVPQLGALVLRVPLAELVAEARHPLLGPGLLLVAAGAAEHGVEAVLLDGVEQRDGLEPVAAGPGAGLLDRPGRRRWTPAREATTRRTPSSRDPAVAELDDLGEVVAGVDVHDRERDAGGPERLLGQVEHDDRVLAAGEEQHRPLELGRHLTDDVDRLGLERLEVGQLVVHRACGSSAVRPGDGSGPVRSSAGRSERRIRAGAAYDRKLTDPGRNRRVTITGAGVADPDDHDLAADLADAAGRAPGRAAGATWSPRAPTRAPQGRGRPPVPRAADGRAGRRPRPTTPCSSEEAGTTSGRHRPARPPPGVDRRPARRHPRVRRGPRTDWAVHVALVEDGVPTAGAVALPAPGHWSCPPAGTAGGPRRRPDRLRVVVSRSRPPAEALAIADALGAELVEMGSAGAKAMAVVRGEADVYAHSGGQYEWDSAAPGGRGAGRRAARAPASTARRSSTTGPTPTCPTCSSAGPSTPPRPGRRSGPAGRRRAGRGD